MDKSKLTLLIVLTVINNVGARCTFPDSLQGAWLGEKDTQTNKAIVFQFDGDTLKSFPLSTPTLESSDFTCVIEEILGDVTRYVLKSSDDINMFSVRLPLYFCLSIQGKKFSIDTGKDKWLNDKLVAYFRWPIDVAYICNAEHSVMSTMIRTSDSNGKVRELERLLVELDERLDDNKNDG